MSRVKIGVIGLGKIAQLKHLHYLFESKKFEVAAISDLSSTLLELVGEKYGIPNRFKDYESMLNLQLDVVMVFTHDHEKQIVDILNSGKHVFVEKPLCWTVQEARRIQEAETRSGKKVMIGYMKRFMPIYQELKEKLDNSNSIKLIKIHTFASGAKNLPESHIVFKDKSLKGMENNLLDSIISRIMEENILSAEDAYNYKMLLELGIHNLNLIVSLLGEPVKIDYCDFWTTRAVRTDSWGKENVKSHKMFLCILEFPNNLKCIWEMGAFFDGKLEWDDSITIHEFEEETTINFPNPFIRDLPIRVEHKTLVNRSHVFNQESIYHPDAFQCQLNYLYEWITTKTEPITSTTEGIRDIKLISNIIKRKV